MVVKEVENLRWRRVDLKLRFEVVDAIMEVLNATRVKFPCAPFPQRRDDRTPKTRFMTSLSVESRCGAVVWGSAYRLLPLRWAVLYYPDQSSFKNQTD